MVDVHAAHPHAQLAVGFLDIAVRLAEGDEQVALAGVLQVFRHVQVRVHARLHYGHAPEFGELGGAGDEHTEAGFGGFAAGIRQVWRGDGAELGADFLVAFRVAALGADGVARPGAERGERGEGHAVFLVGLLDAGGEQVVQDDGGKVALLAAEDYGGGQRAGVRGLLGLTREAVAELAAEGAI